MSKKKKNLAKQTGQARSDPHSPGSQPTGRNKLATPDDKLESPTSVQDPSTHQPDQKPNRRDFLATSAVLLTGLSGVGICSMGLRLAVADFELGPPAQFPIGTPADYKMGSLTWLRDRDLFVLHAQEGLGAFSARCTHLGCTVQRTSDGFRCPCHGARFGPLGQVISGPARKGLPWFALHLEPDGRLWVTTHKIVEPGVKYPRLSEQTDSDGGDQS